MSLTPYQVRLLTLMADNSPVTKFTGQDILDLDGEAGTWGGREGVHLTAGSLSRRGLAIKHQAMGRGSVSYSITVAGKRALAKAQKAPKITRSKP